MNGPGGVPVVTTIAGVDAGSSNNNEGLGGSFDGVGRAARLYTPTFLALLDDDTLVVRCDGSMDFKRLTNISSGTATVTTLTPDSGGVQPRSLGLAAVNGTAYVAVYANALVKPYFGTPNNVAAIDPFDLFIATLEEQPDLGGLDTTIEADVSVGIAAYNVSVAATLAALTAQIRTLTATVATLSSSVASLQVNATTLASSCALAG